MNVLSPITCDVIHKYAEETCDTEFSSYRVRVFD